MAMDRAAGQPFGYYFTPTEDESSLQGGSSSGLLGDGPLRPEPLLSHNETQDLDNFFGHIDLVNNNNHGHNHDHNYEPLPSAQETELDFDNGWDLGPPANVYHISTVADPAQLQRGFHAEPAEQTEHGSVSYPVNTYGDSQTASLAFNDVQDLQPNTRPYSVSDQRHGLHTNADSSVHINDSFPNLPVISDPYFTALVSNYSTNDHQVTTELRQPHIPQHTTYLPPPPPPPPLPPSQLQQQQQQSRATRRELNYGTDANFHPSGYNNPTHSPVHDLASRAMHNLFPVQPPARQSAESKEPSTPINENCSPRKGPQDLINDDKHLTKHMLDDAEDRRAKKRSKSRIPTERNEPRSRPPDAYVPSDIRNRNLSLSGHPNKTDRRTSAGRKAHRENLTDEQKRRNHLQSEQKRRDLSKRGFEDLQHLVPELRDGRPTKRVVLEEAIKFLKELVENNAKYTKLVADNC